MPSHVNLSLLILLQESNPALRLKEEVIAANSLTGTGFSSSGFSQETASGQIQDEIEKKKISFDAEDSVDDVDDIDEVENLTIFSCNYEIGIFTN